MAKFTENDIKLLAKQMRASCKDEKPFTLLTGAGCSVSAGIPLAGTLVKEILKTYGDECRRQLDDEQLRDYGACMSCVPINARRKLFSDHLKKAKINWAHIAIACLMNAGYVGRVITFNFDSILARACSLLGMYPPTYDFAAAATVDTDYIAPQAIIHLHGQGTGKHLLNSDKETHNHAENIRPLIRATFTESSLLVIGYSGSSDAVFPVLTQEYSGRENLWWAGYESSPNLNIEGLIRPYSGVAYYLGECDADEFLIELANELDCFPPTLFSDPYGHLLNELKPVVEFPLTESESSDLLTGLKHELIESQKRLNTYQKIPELIMKGEWDTVIKLSNPENPAHQKNLTWAYILKGNEIAKQAKRSNNEGLFKESLSYYQKAIAIKPDIHAAFYNWGNALVCLFQITQDESYLEKSKEVLTKTEKLNSAYVYNFACAYSLLNEKDKCKEKLLHCRDAKTLPDKAHLREDKDLENIRSEPWFEELISSID